MKPTLTPHCPLCDRLPFLVIGETALCGNEECVALSWDVTITLDENLANSKMVDIRPSNERE